MSFYGRFLREVACAGLTVGAGPLETVRRSQLVSLPEPAQRYAEYMGVVDRPQDWSFRLGSSGRFRTKPDQPWMKARRGSTAAARRWLAFFTSAYDSAA